MVLPTLLLITVIEPILFLVAKWCFLASLCQTQFCYSDSYHRFWHTTSQKRPRQSREELSIWGGPSEFSQIKTSWPGLWTPALTRPYRQTAPLMPGGGTTYGEAAPFLPKLQTQCYDHQALLAAGERGFCPEEGRWVVHHSSYHSSTRVRSD